MPRSASVDAHGLDEPQAAGAVPDGRGDLLRDVEPIGRQVDVVGDERHAGADDRGAGGRVRRRRAEVRRPRGLLHLGRQTFELAAPDVLEVAPRRRARRPPRRERPAACARGNGVGHRPWPSATQSAIVAPSIGTNGTTSTAPMRGCSPVCVPEIDARDAASNSASTAARHTGGVAGERVHRPVVRRVRLHVEQPDAR